MIGGFRIVAKAFYVWRKVISKPYEKIGSDMFWCLIDYRE